MDNIRREILKVDKTRNHKVKNSLGTYDAYKWIRKNNWLDIGRRVTEHEFYSVIRMVNMLLADSLISGEDIVLPHKMGRLGLRKRIPNVWLNKGRVESDYPIDWDRTLKLWSEDFRAYRDRVLVRHEDRSIFRIVYDKSKADYNNKLYYSFNTNREIKKEITRRAKNKTIDAFLWKDT